MKSNSKGHILLFYMRKLHVFPIEASYHFLNLLLYITTAKGNNVVIIEGAARHHGLTFSNHHVNLPDTALQEIKHV